MRLMCGCPENFVDSLTIYAHRYFPKILHELLFRLTMRICVQNLKSVTLHVPDIIGDWSFGWGLRTPNLEEGEALEGRGWYRSKER